MNLKKKLFSNCSFRVFYIKYAHFFSDIRTLCYASKVVRFEIDQSSRKVDKSLLKTIVGKLAILLIFDYVIYHI